MRIKEIELLILVKKRLVKCVYMEKQNTEC